MASIYDNVFAAIAKGYDFNPLGNFSEGYGTGRKLAIAQQAQDEEARRNQALEELKRQELARGPDMPTSRQEFLLAQSDPAYAAHLERRAQRGDGITIIDGNAYRTNDLNSPNPRPIVQAAQKPRTASSLAGEQKTTKSLDLIGSTLSYLDEAEKLAPLAYTGADTFGYTEEAANVGTNWPNASRFIGIDPKRAEATKALGDIMKSEAFKEMASVLPGPASDRDVAEFKAVMADPNASAARKLGAIKRMRTRLLAAQKSEQEMLKKWQSDGQPAGPPQQGEAPPPAGADPLTAGGEGAAGEAAGLVERLAQARPEQKAAVLRRFMERHKLDESTARQMLGM